METENDPDTEAAPEKKEDAFTIKEIAPDDGKQRRFEKTIFFEYRSPIDDKLYTGNFTFKKLNIGGLSKVGVRHATLNGGFQPGEIDEATNDLNLKVATLMGWFEGTDLPSWAKDWSTLYDPAIIYRLYKEGNSFEATFRRAVGE